MKTIIVAIIAMLFLCVPAAYAETEIFTIAKSMDGVQAADLSLTKKSGASLNFSSTPSKKYEKAAQLATFSAIVIVDYNQTSEALFDRKGFEEANPILGKHPSKESLMAFNIASVAAMYIIVELLPEPWSTIWLDSHISSGKWNIEDNELLLNGGRRRINAMPFILSLRF